MEKIYKDMKDFYNTNDFSYSFRIKILKTLKKQIQTYEDDILEALKKDLNKPYFESYVSEINIVYDEIDIAIKNLKKWMKRKKVSTPLVLQPAKSYIYPHSKGIVFIISPWNYPFQLCIVPLIGSISSGNCTIIKPSNKSLHTSELINEILSVFDDKYIYTLLGSGSSIVPNILENYKFDHIFFTGSKKVGQSILKLSSKFLTPTSLELGGKSPCIVFSDCNLDESSKKIVFGKYFNAGQTCVAPDYILVEDKIYNKFIDLCIKHIKTFYNKENFPTIIDKNNFNRILSYINSDNVLYGGSFDINKLYIEPTIVKVESFEELIMKEEIFGPIMPIIKFSHLNDIYNIVNLNKNPLSLYLFTRNKTIQNEILNNINFGGGCINNTLNHFANPYLPFGGIHDSGMGKYHSKYTFDLFTNYKSIYKSGPFEFNIKYPPYNKLKTKIVKRL